MRALNNDLKPSQWLKNETLRMGVIY